MPKYNKAAVDRAIANAGANADEAGKIHRLLRGRHENHKTEETRPKNTKRGPRGNAAMSRERFLAGLAGLGHNVNTANQLLGIGRSTIYRMASGQAVVPPVIARLMDMYERYGIPKEHQS